MIGSSSSPIRQDLLLRYEPDVAVLSCAELDRCSDLRDHQLMREVPLVGLWRRRGSALAQYPKGTSIYSIFTTAMSGLC